MSLKCRERFLLAVLAGLFAFTQGAFAQTASDLLPNPYKPIQNWAKLPQGRTWGAAAGIAIDHKGNIWVLERCGGNSCGGRTEDPVLEFDTSGNLMKSFGSGLLVFPHGLFLDKNDNVWVTDADGKDGKGQQVIEFSPGGKVLMTLGTPGVAGDGPDTFNRPSGVVVAPNGDIFVADGHGGNSNARIVKFSKDGKFIKTWGKKGSAPGEFDELHAITIGPKGRVFVADRGNNRIQIFNQDGEFLDQWTQFGRPSGIFISAKGIIYVPDNSNKAPGAIRGIRVGNLSDGKVTAFLPDADQDVAHAGYGAENVVADANGNIYAADVFRKMVWKYVKE